VAGGAGDNAAAAIGMGTIHDGQAFASLGTSGVLFAANNAYLPNAESAVHAFCHALPNTWHQMGVILAATDSLNWYEKITGVDAADLTGRWARRLPARRAFSSCPISAANARRTTTPRFAACSPESAMKATGTC
jgi:xylulokinase